MEGYADPLATAISRHMLRAAASDEWLSWAVVDSYDPDTHRVACTLHPSLRQTGYLRMTTTNTAGQHAIAPGTQVMVGLVRGVAEVAFGPFHSNSDPPPGAELLHIQGNGYVGGTLQAGAFVLNQVPVLPTPTIDWRGAIVLLAPSSDGANPATADTLQVCLQSATGTLSWKVLATG